MCFNEQGEHLHIIYDFLCEKQYTSISSLFHFLDHLTTLQSVVILTFV